MGKKRSLTPDEIENVIDSGEALPATHLSNQTEVVETAPDSPEVAAAKAELETLETARKKLNAEIAALKAIINPKAAKAVKTAKGITFIIPEGDSSTIMNKNGKPLVLQAKWILDNLVIGKGEVGSEIVIEGDKLEEALSEFPTSGDVMNNFRWIANQILKPIGIVKA